MKWFVISLIIGLLAAIGATNYRQCGNERVISVGIGNALRLRGARL